MHDEHALNHLDEVPLDQLREQFSTVRAEDRVPPTGGQGATNRTIAWRELRLAAPPS